MNIIFNNTVSFFSMIIHVFKKQMKLLLLMSTAAAVLVAGSSLYAEPLLKRNTGNSAVVEENSRLEDELNKLRYDFFKLNESMQSNMQTLQGIIEQQNYKIEQIRKSERQRYADLDRRTTQLESRLEKAASNQTSAMGSLEQEDEKTYLSAKKKIDNNEYNAAIAELLLYLEFFSKGKYAGQANYWLGELYLALAVPERDSAKKHFEIVASQFPDNAKVPDSLYKLGVTQLALKETNVARLSFEKVIKEFPESSAAGLAKTQLSKM